MAEGRRRRIGQLLGPLMGLIGVCALFAVLEPASFLSVYNFQTIAAQTVKANTAASTPSWGTAGSRS